LDAAIRQLADHSPHLATWI